MAIELIYMAIALLLAPALGEVAKIRIKADKGFAWMAVAGGFYILAAAFQQGIAYAAIDTSLAYGTMIFSVLGLVAALIGAISIMVSMMR